MDLVILAHLIELVTLILVHTGLVVEVVAGVHVSVVDVVVASGGIGEHLRWKALTDDI